MNGGGMKRRAVDRVALPAGKSVELKPGSLHVMMMDTTHPLAEGQTVPVTLTIVSKDGKRTTQEVKAPVLALTAATGMPKR